MNDLARATSVVGLFRWHARNTPDKDAVLFVTDPEASDDVASWSYRELDRQARTIAAQLRQTCPAGSRALLMYPVGLAFVAAFLGCLYAGVIAVPAPLPGRYRHQRRRLQAIASDAGVTAVLTDCANLAEVAQWALAEGLTDVEPIATDAADLPAPDDWTPVEPTRDTIALLQYTSGSTGDAKGVIISHDNLLSNIEALTRAMNWTPDLRSGGWLPLYHDMGLSGELLPALLFGSCCVLMEPMTFIRRPYSWLRAIDKYDVNVTLGPNFAYDLCVRKVSDEEVAKLDLSRVRLAINGSEPIHPSVMVAFAERFAPSGFRAEAFTPAYGLAEATVYVCTGRGLAACAVDADLLERGEFVPAGEGRPIRRAVSCGPVTDFDLRIVDPVSARVLPPGRIGELWLRGASIARGYWGRESATRDVFHAVTADGDGGYLRTGDLGTVHGGEVYVTGRIKEMLIANGRNLYPQDIEHELRIHHPELASVGAVFGVPGSAGAGDAERLVVTHEVRGVLPRENLPTLAAAMRHTVSREFGVQVAATLLLRPGAVRRTTSGKIQRSAMRELFLAGELPSLYSDQR